MRKVQPVGAVLLPFRGLIQDATPVRVPGSGRLRNSALVGIPVRPQGSGLGCLPIRSLQQGGTARDRRAASSTSSAGSSRSPLTVAEARDALRTVVSTPFKSPRIARLSSSAPSRPGSNTGPRRSSCSTVSSPGIIPTSTASVEVSQQEFQKQDDFGFVSSCSMPLEAISIASNSVTASTKSKYKSMFLRFQQFGRAKGINILQYSFSKILFIGFLISIYNHKGSIGSLLMARAAVKFYWVLNSACESPSPTDSEFVQKFFKGLQNEKRIHNPATKAYPLTYLELEQLFSGVCGSRDFTDLTFAKQRFIAMLIISYSSFCRFEEIQTLLVEQVFLVNVDFSVHFKKGKRYRESRFGVIPHLPDRDFNPAAIFMQYREVVASLHANNNSFHDYLFPNSTTKKHATVLKDEPVKYDAFLRKLKSEASLAHLSCAELQHRLGAHSLRRGPVTVAVNAGTSDLHVQKLMRVDSLGMVHYYSEADHKLLLAASKSAF